MRSIPKVASGLDDVIPGSLDAVVHYYGRVFNSIIPIFKPKVAEMCKLYENCQRMMCIAYQDPPLLPNLSLPNKTKSSCCRYILVFSNHAQIQFTRRRIHTVREGNVVGQYFPPRTRCTLAPEEAPESPAKTGGKVIATRGTRRNASPIRDVVDAVGKED
ncbi:UDP-n-acetyl-D-mannosamine 6-dehydrogenase [Fusarium mundagurra]|uniref:UDP-n-acetyl-D-mannosamine 6-dehydrogenase n=1 Tax=Fusarium mundagurra TaxID=1567541 RepID=A0A8H6DPW8_9HYPO|nr:UDP-n-acetyl-D-mannosamine 6-dehydrogenase [Fusarium mundagurra]